MTEFRKEVVRWMLLLGGGFAGAAVSAGYVWLNWDRLQRLPRDSFGEMAILFNATIIFFITLYTVGKYGYRFFGLHADAREVQDNDRWHIAALYVVLIGFLVLGMVFE